MSTKVNQFISVTGASQDTARRLLNACAGNLELAIGMYMEDGAASQDTGISNVNHSPIPIPLVRISPVFAVGENVFSVSIEMKMKSDRQFYQYRVCWLKMNLLQVN